MIEHEHIKKLNGREQNKNAIVSSDTIAPLSSYVGRMGMGFLKPSDEILTRMLDNAAMYGYTEVEEEIQCLVVEEELHTSVVCSHGNISMVSGKAKSRKTFLVTSIVASLLTGSLILKFKGQLPVNKKNVLYVDTEQSQRDCKKVLDRINHMMGLEENGHPGNLIYIRLRPFDPKLRLCLIEHALDYIPNLGFVVIDGIKDVVFSINDEAEATDISSKLLKWSEEKKIHILTVLHKNKTDDNNRGHLGTELENKSETVLNVIKSKENKDISVVECQMMRNKDFESFAFTINENNVPELAEWNCTKPQKKERNPSDFDDQTHYNILNYIFPANNNCSARTFYGLLKESLEKLSIYIGYNKARDFLDYYLKKEIILNSGSGSQNKLILNDSFIPGEVC
jgi:KaiC/GvpD/RAD55 family RecA-like ATPase